MTSEVPADVAQPSGPPTGTTTEEAAIDALVTSALPDTRKAAENWRTGLAALLALVTTVLFIKGKSDFKDFDDNGKRALAILLIAALIAAAAGAWFALKAAYGQPRQWTVADIEADGGVDAWKLARAQRAVSDLRWAQLLSYVALALVAGAVLTTWVANDAPTSPIALVNVERVNTSHAICGELLRFDAGTIKIKVDAEHSPVFPISEITSLTLVPKCAASSSDMTTPTS